MKAHIWLVLTLFMLSLFEGTVLQVFAPDAFGVSIFMIPRFALIGVIYIALYLGRKRGLWYGLGFGLLQDLLYSDVVGVYAFGMAVTGYFAGLAFKLFHQSLLLILLTIVISLLFHDLTVYGFYFLFGITGDPLHWMLFTQMIPTLFLNVMFALLIYLPMKRLLQGMELEREEGES